MTSLERLVLGTASWGQRYGVANATPLRQAQVDCLLDTAASKGIYKLDTALSYGKTCELLSASILDQRWEVTTKFAHREASNKTAMRELALQALQALGLDQVDTLLVHDQIDASKFELLMETFQDLQRDGHINSYGFSLYSFADVDPKQLSLIQAAQVPGSIVARREIDFALSSWKPKSGEKRLQLRSIFLQGLLIGRASLFRVPIGLGSHLTQFNSWCEKNFVTPFDACVSFAAALPSTDVVVGLHTVSELDALVTSWESSNALTSVPGEFPADVSDPRNWGLL